MKLKKFTPLLRGLAATTAALLTLSTVAYTVAMSNIAIGWMDGWFKVDRTKYKDWDETIPSYTIPGSTEGYSYLAGKSYETEHATVEEYVEALKAHTVKQGEEGFALLKNDNEALPLAANANVALFGWSCYNLPNGHTGVVAGNYDHRQESSGNVTEYWTWFQSVTLYDALNAIDGINVNTTVKAEDFTGAMISAGMSGTDREGNPTTYKLPEVFEEKTTWVIPENSIGIVAVGRGGGEGSNYMTDDAENADDPLALSTEEMEMIDYSRTHCAKTVVLVVSANAMELGPIAKGGDHEVDAIGFCGIPNDFQYEGIANVLAGKANATGGLTDTYAYDNSYNPAVINMGQQQYADLNTISSFTDPLGRGTTSYQADNYIVEAEGIYVGYKYYESRYYDSIVNPDYNAKDTIGSSTGEAWDYSKEVVFPFGQSLSYIPYKQEITSVHVDLTEAGNITATVRVTNEGDKDGTFLAQLYVNKPYTQYDIEHKVEKSAIDFLSSAKVEVKAGKSADVKIVLPTHYLASWDSTALSGAGTYILDPGDYYFTAAAGAHEAVNNVLEAQEKDTDGTTDGSGICFKWSEIKALDEQTFANSNGVAVRNQMKNADINYFLGEDTVTYLSRSNYKTTFPKNYTNRANDSGIQPEPKFTIKGAEKEEEWLIELINAQYKPVEETDESKWAKVEPTTPAQMAGGSYTSVWQWIMSVAVSKPEAFNNIHSEEWQAVAAAIPLGVAVASVPSGGHATKEFPGIGNPGSVQSESVAGYSQSLKVGTKDGHDRTLNLNVASNTLLGSSFNPALAYEWGKLEGEGGLWLQKTQSPSEYASNAVTVWGAGLNQHRHPYNGRNSEYMSEDPMLTNRIGAEQLRGATECGSICGPKHMGFNDQELNRVGNAAYMTEQKVRETDTRCYEGALRVHEGNGTGVMMSFARIGATNVTNSVGYIKNIMREEWGFTGIVTTDMGRANSYHEAGALIQATVNQLASMRGGNFYMGSSATDYSDSATVGSAQTLTLGSVKKDPAFAAQARQTALYELYTIAHSGSGLYVEVVANTGEDIVVPESTIHHHDPDGQIAHASWEYIFIGLEAAFGVLTAIAGGAWIASIVIPEKKEEN